MENIILKNHFLIAMPSLTDPNFRQSVTYIYAHDEQAGALGIVINKPMRITLGDVLRHLTIPISNPQVDRQPVLLGGPIAQEQGFIILPTDTTSTKEEILAENDHIIISSSKRILSNIASDQASTQAIVSLGYSGWSAGQLEQEILDNAWLVAPVDKTILFDLPFANRWRAAAASIGVNVDYLSGDVGHA